MSISKLVIVLALLAPSLLVQAQDITVRSDEKLNNENFDRYTTYYWSSQVDPALDTGNQFQEGQAMKVTIHDAVRNELEERGYKPQANNPDLIVNFRILDRPITVKGYDGHRTSHWENMDYRTPEDTTSYSLEAGTLVISLSDRNAGDVVWQGFASGLDKNNAKEEKIREAVNMVFDRYTYRARELSKR